MNKRHTLDKADKLFHMMLTEYEYDKDFLQNNHKIKQNMFTRVAMLSKMSY